MTSPFGPNDSVRYGPVSDEEQKRWDAMGPFRAQIGPITQPEDLFGPMFPTRGNGRSWRWTARARRLGVILLLAATAAGVLVAGLIGEDRQQDWREKHSVKLCTATAHDAPCKADGDNEPTVEVEVGQLPTTAR